LGRYDARAGPGGQRAGARWRSLADRGQRYFSSSIVSYLAGELHSAGSAYAPFIDIVNRWNFSHDGKQLPDTIPDLAAALTLNPAMKIMAISGYHDLATPFHQTDLDLARLGENSVNHIEILCKRPYDVSRRHARRAQQTDLINFLNSVTVSH
jgi:hypothetical protein